MHWQKSLNKQIQLKEPLSAHTTLGVGGPANVWALPANIQELSTIVTYSNAKNLPYMVVGNGSNLLFQDSGFKGVVINLNAAFFRRIEFKGRYVFAGAGMGLSLLIRDTQKQGLTGLESLAGIPASVGGAVLMNAGSVKKSIGKLAEAVIVMNEQGRVKVLRKEQLRFGYRKSNLNKYIVLEILFKLTRKSPGKIQEAIIKRISQKRKTQPLNAKSAGCVFRNPKHRLSAAAMIDACGLKSTCVGNAQISEKHANYIINKGNAKSRDILRLLELVQKEVYKKFKVRLKPEIKII